MTGNKKRGVISVAVDKTALKIWDSARNARGTLVEAYLAARGIGGLSSTIDRRFHPRLKHPSGGVWPAMVAAVTRGVGSRQTAIHRTFLTPDGMQKAPVDPQKMMLGPCRGCAVKSGEPCNKVLMVGKGVETCLAAMLVARSSSVGCALYRRPACPRPAASILRDVIILADGDEAGRGGSAWCPMLRWKREGRCVRIDYAPEGMDFNDLLLGNAPMA